LEDNSNSPAELAIREMAEEVDLTADRHRLEPLSLYRTGREGIADYVFVYALNDDEYSRLAERVSRQNLNEGRAWQFMGIDQIKGLDLAFEQDRIIPDLEQRLGMDID